MDDYLYFDDKHPLHDDEDEERYKPRKKKRTRPENCRRPVLPPPLDLTVVGRKCIIDRNEGLATQIDQGSHLIDYFEHYQQDNYTTTNDGEEAGDWVDITHCEKQHAGVDVSQMKPERTGIRSACDQGKKPVLLMDRYDARTLLEDLSEFESPRHIHNGDDIDDCLTEEENRLIAIERFGDLTIAEDKEEQLNAEVEEKDHRTESFTVNINNTSQESDFELSDNDKLNLPDGIKVVSSCKPLISHWTGPLRLSH